MKHHKKAGFTGITIALTLFIVNMYHAIRISKGFSFSESLLPEIINALLIQIPLLAPSIVLLLSENFKKKYSYVPWLYPIIVTFGTLTVFLAKGPIAAGLPMVMFVIPLCIVLAIAFYFLGNKSLTKK